MWSSCHSVIGIESEIKTACGIFSRPKKETLRSSGIKRFCGTEILAANNPKSKNFQFSENAEVIKRRYSVGTNVKKTFHFKSVSHSLI